MNHSQDDDRHAKTPQQNATIAMVPILLALMCHIGLYALSTVVAVLSPGVLAFTPVVRNEIPSHRFSFDRHGFDYNRQLVHGGIRTPVRLRAESLSTSEKEDLLDTIRSMRVKELKAELTERKISTADAFEKEELVKRLYDARLASPTPPKAKVGAKSTTASKQNTDANVIRGELSFASLDSGQSIAGTLGSESIRISDADIQPYPTMTINVVDSNNAGFPLKLLVDTACSGLVLTPSAVQRNNMRTDSRSVSMTGAGGGAMGMGATMIDRFTFGYEPREPLGPLIAAVQDAGALGPLGLDGIIGLSFLSKYACTEIDLERSEISLYKTDYRPLFDESDLEVVAEGELSPTRLGIWTVDVAFEIGGKRGRPIKMLVDTGSTSTILSWKGLENGLGLSRSSPEVQAQQEMGAMGSDNVAMSLTHKIEVDTPIRFGTPRGRTPPPYDGLSIGQGKPTTVDIGEIAVVDTQLSADNVGGILGMNVLSKASMIRMVFSGPIPRITLFQKKSRSSSSGDGGGGDGDDDNKTPNPPRPSPTTTTSTSTSTSTSTAEVEPESDSDIPPTSSTATPVPEDTKPRKKKKKRRY